MPEFLQVVMSNPAAFGEAATALRSGAEEFRTTGQDFRAGTNTAFAGWQGKTMKRARKVTDRFVAGAGGMANWIERAADAASEGGTTMMELVTALREGVQQAQVMGFLVFPTGQVFPGPTQISQAAAAGPGAGAVLEMYQGLARMYQAYFQVCIQMVTAQDQITGRAIQGLMLQLDSEIPFRSSLRAPMWFVRGNEQANNQARGRLANELNAISASMRHEQEVGAEVPIYRSAGDPEHMRADRILLGDDDLFVDEVKAGASGPTPRQQDILPRIGQGGPQIDPQVGGPGVPTGPLRPGQASVRVERWDVDSLPESVRNEVYQNNRTLSDVLAGRGGGGPASDLRAWMDDPASRVTTLL